MRSVPVVAVKPSGQLGCAFVRGVIGTGIGPLAQARLDEALSLAGSFGRVRLGSDVLRASFLQALGAAGARATSGEELAVGDPTAARWALLEAADMDKYAAAYLEIAPGSVRHPIWYGHPGPALLRVATVDCAVRARCERSSISAAEVRMAACLYYGHLPT